MQFQSTFPAPKPTLHKCIVYDARDGRIIWYTHFSATEKPASSAIKVRPNASALRSRAHANTPPHKSTENASSAPESLGIHTL